MENYLDRQGADYLLIEKGRNDADPTIRDYAVIDVQNKNGGNTDVIDYKLTPFEALAFAKAEALERGVEVVIGQGVIDDFIAALSPSARIEAGIANPTVVIHLEDGCVQGVYSNVEGDLDVFTMDFDTEGNSEDDWDFVSAEKLEDLEKDVIPYDHGSAYDPEKVRVARAALGMRDEQCKEHYKREDDKRKAGERRALEKAGAIDDEVTS